MGTGEKVLLIGGAGLGLWLWLSGSFGSTAAPATTATGGTTPPVTPPAAPVPTPVLDQTYTQLVAAMTAAADPAITKVGTVISADADVFNYYLSHLPNSPVPAPPDAGAVFGPGLNTVIMTSSQYWAKMAPYLQQYNGLNGVGHFAGLGNFMQQANPVWGW